MDIDRKYDLSFLERISNSDEKFIKNMIVTFKNTAPRIITKMVKYIEGKKYASLGKEVHKFVPGISFLGAKYIENDLIKIEENVRKNKNLDKIPGLLENVKKNIADLIIQFDNDFNLS